MIQPNKFKDLNKRFKSLETGMTQMNKFEELNGRFTVDDTDKSCHPLGVPYPY
jgi:hypothetical protein